MFLGSAFLVFGIGALFVLICRLAVDALTKGSLALLSRKQSRPE